MQFFKQMSNFLLIFVVFGLWSSVEHFQKKCFLQLCSILSMALAIFSFSSAIFYKHFRTMTSISNVIANSLYMSTVFSCSILFAETFMKRSVQQKLIQKFITIDKLFHTELNVVITYATEKRQIFIWNLALMLAKALVLSVSLAMQLFQNRFHNLFLPSIYLSWLMFLRLIEVLFFVHLMRTRLIFINDELQNIQNELNLQINFIHRLRNQCLGQTKIQYVILDGQTIRPSMIDRILCLKRIYGELCSIRKSFNAIFEWSLSAIFTQYFVGFTSISYWAYLTLDRFIDFVFVTVEILPQMTALSALCFYCSSCCQYVRFTLKYVGNRFF